jgi:hypothetical protein
MTTEKQVLTAEKRTSIIHRLWSFEEATAASQAIKNLSVLGIWGELPPTPTMMEFAEACSSHPTRMVAGIQGKIIEAYEAKFKEGLLP